jgi:peptidoglycan/LPS O-acetylase OafA/YrhL
MSAVENRLAYPTFETLYASRKNNFNFLRLFFASLVIFSHAYVLVYGIEKGKQLEPLSRSSNGQIDFGSLAVDGFFMISGFLLVQSWVSSRGLLTFSWRRFLRIYPGLATCLLICTFIVGPLGGADLTTYFSNPLTYRPLEFLFMRNFWNSLPGVFSPNPMPDLNSSLWTIKYEIFCYICVALLGLARLLRPMPVLVVVITAGLLFNVLEFRELKPLFPAFSFRVINDFLYDPMPRFLTFFFSGTLFYLYRAKIPHSALLFCLSLAAVILFFHLALYVVLPIFGGYMLFYLSLTPKIHLAWFDEVDLSYGVYIFAWPVGQLIIFHRLLWMQNPWLLFGLSLPPTFALAALSWFLVEKPFLKLKRKHPQAPALEPEVAPRAS